MGFTWSELAEALRQIESMISKLENALTRLPESAKSPRTLVESRVTSLRIAAELIRARAAEELYPEAKACNWEVLLKAWRDDQLLGQVCSHYVNPSWGWTFLHQAAFCDAEDAACELIRLGASVDAEAKGGQRPFDVADARGYSGIAALLTNAAISHHLWAAPTDSRMLPSSNLWNEWSKRLAERDMCVCYDGQGINIRKGEAYFVDTFGRVLVGWRGSYNPPRGMNANPMILGYVDD